MFKVVFSNNWQNNTIDINDIACSDVLNIAIEHEESKIANAVVEITNCIALKDNNIIKIFKDDNLLFKGKISKIYQDSSFIVKILAICLKPDYEKDIDTAIKDNNLEINEFLKEKNLLFNQSKLSASDYLESTNKLFYFDRLGEGVFLTDYFFGNKIHDIGFNYIDSSLKFEHKRFLIKDIVFDIDVEWVQSLSGEIFGIKYIKEAFENGVISSLNKDFLINNWPKQHQKLGMGKKNSGYYVEKSFLKAIDAPANLADKVKIKDKYFNIYYFDGALNIYWDYQQKRIEKIQIRTFDANKCNESVKKLYLKIALDDNKKANFIDTKEAEKLLDYLKRIITANIKASYRNIKIAFEIPLKTALNFTIDDSILLKTHIIGFKNINAKITKLKFIISATKQYALIEAFAVFDLEKLYKKTIFKEILADQVKGIISDDLNALDLIEKINVANSLTQQVELIAQNNNNLNILEIADTSIFFKLKDLRTKETLIRNVAINC